jgi:hypothetical protein
MLVCSRCGQTGSARNDTIGSVTQRVRDNGGSAEGVVADVAPCHFCGTTDAVVKQPSVWCSGGLANMEQATLGIMMRHHYDAPPQDDEGVQGEAEAVAEDEPHGLSDDDAEAAAEWEALLAEGDDADSGDASSPPALGKRPWEQAADQELADEGAERADKRQRCMAEAGGDGDVGGDAPPPPALGKRPREQADEQALPDEGGGHEDKRQWST